MLANISRMSHVHRGVLKAIFVLIAFHLSSGSNAQNSIESPILSTTSDDYSDLAFIDALVENKDVIFLGESRHGIEDFNEMKFRIVRYLHEKHDFNLVVFEAGVHEVAMTNILRDSLNSLEMLTQSLMGYWLTESNCAMMKYLSDNQIDIAGMDLVSHSLPPKRRSYGQIYEDQNLAEKIFELDSLFYFDYRFCMAEYMFSDNWESWIENQEMDSLANYLLENYSEAKEELKFLQTKNLKRLLWANNAIVKELKVTRKLSGEYISAKDSWRDSTMALNLKYAIDSIYPNQKTIVWAHDIHISKTGDHQNGTSMGMFLSDEMKERSLVIGLEAISGTYRVGYNPLNKIKLYNTHVEKQYKRIKTKGVYISSADVHLKNRTDRLGRLHSDKIREMFDGFIFLRDVTGSEFLKPGKPNNCE